MVVHCLIFFHFFAIIFNYSFLADNKLYILPTVNFPLLDNKDSIPDVISCTYEQEKVQLDSAASKPLCFHERQVHVYVKMESKRPHAILLSSALYDVSHDLRWPFFPYYLYVLLHV